MLKRLIALIGALVLVFTLTIPCFADVTSNYHDQLVTDDFNSSFDGPILFLSGSVEIVLPSSMTYFFEVLYFFCFNGQLRAFSPDDITPVIICHDGILDIYNYGSFVDSVQTDNSTIYINYNESDIIYASSNCSMWGFTCASTEGGSSGGFTQDDLDDARQEGYDEGFTKGQQSVDQDAIRQEGYDEGFIAGQNSIDQDIIRQEGYDDGYADGDAFGQKIGYNEGFNAALEQFGSMSGGVFEYLVLDVRVYHDLDGDSIENADRITNVPFDKTLGGVYFNSTLNYLIDKYGTDEFNRVDLILKFDSGYYFGQDPIDWSASPIFISGSSLVESARIKTVDGIFYDLSANDGALDTLRSFSFVDISEVSFPVIVDQFSLMVGRPGDLLSEISLWCNSEFYNYGYAAGYAEGLSSDSTESYNTGYASGYDTGFLEGKNEGLNLGKSGDWKSLMTAVVEAPINTFQSLFNFEILGLDMRAAFGSILAVCVVLIIIKKVIL